MIRSCQGKTEISPGTFFDNGAPLGFNTCQEAQIDSLPQSWAVISGSADPGLHAF
jgi:cellobiose phosphorylase